MGVDHFLAGFPRANAVPPMVLIGEAAARPAKQGDFNRAQSLDDVIAHTACVGDIRILPDPDAAVDAAPQMLGKMPVYIAVDLSYLLLRIDRKNICHKNSALPKIYIMIITQPRWFS
jgi:hypothetical protein